MNTPQSNQYTPIQLENIKAAAVDLLECLAGNEVEMPEQIRPISWLGILLRACNRQPVYDALVKDSAGDFDAINTMLCECKWMAERAEAAIQKALSAEAGLPKEEPTLSQQFRKIWGMD